MERTAPFDLTWLQRDWIAGLPAGSFQLRFELWQRRCCEAVDRPATVPTSPAALQSGRGSWFLRGPEGEAAGMVLCEPDPVEFTAVFLAGAATGLPLVLANHRWGAREWTQLAGLLRVELPPPGGICIPTGGTTGGLKLAVHTWGSLAAAVEGLRGFLGGGPIHCCGLLPLHHVSGLMPVLRSLLTGGRLRFDDQESSGYCLSLVPTQLRRALDDPQALARLRSARVVFVGGAAMPEGLVREVRRVRLPIVPVYGMTETAAMVAAIPGEVFLEDPEAGARPIGQSRFTLDPAGQIRIQGPSLFQGYLGRAPIHLSAGYLTGDLGRLDAGGGLHVIGRMDGLINSGGEKVDPREVESVLLAQDGIEAARVVGEADEEWGQAVVAYVRLRDAAIKPADILTILRAELAPYKVPKRIEFE